MRIYNIYIIPKYICIVFVLQEFENYIMDLIPTFCMVSLSGLGSLTLKDFNH